MCGKAKKSKCLMEIGRAHCLLLITSLYILVHLPRPPGGREGLGGGGQGPRSPRTDSRCDLRPTALSGLPFNMRYPFASGGPEGSALNSVEARHLGFGDLGMILSPSPS